MSDPTQEQIFLLYEQQRIYQRNKVIDEFLRRAEDLAAATCGITQDRFVFICELERIAEEMKK